VLAPVFLRLAHHRRTRRVFHFKPVGRAARTVGRVFPLRDDAFKAKLAAMGEDGRAVALHMLIDRMPGAALASASTGSIQAWNETDRAGRSLTTGACRLPGSPP